MKGELERIYKQYKDEKRLDDTPIQPVQKISPHTGKQGVPDPLLDGENDIDLTSVIVCPKCGSFNVSVDMSTNKIVCLECGEKPEKATKVDFQKMMEKVREEEQERIIDSLKRGDVFLK